MHDMRTLDELKDLGSGHPAPHDVARFYHQAFAAFGTRALWNWRELDPPSITQALAVAESLRAEGNRDSRALAAQIEQACRAAL
jgi:hypothetical protein